MILTLCSPYVFFFFAFFLFFQKLWSVAAFSGLQEKQKAAICAVYGRFLPSIYPMHNRSSLKFNATYEYVARSRRHSYAGRMFLARFHRSIELPHIIQLLMRTKLQIWFFLSFSSFCKGLGLGCRSSCSSEAYSYDCIL